MKELHPDAKELLDAYIESQKKDTANQVRELFDDHKAKFVKAAVAALGIITAIFGYTLKTIVENVANTEVNKRAENVDERIYQTQLKVAELDVLRATTAQKLEAANSAADELSKTSNNLNSNLNSGKDILDAIGALNKSRDEIVAKILNSPDFLNNVKTEISHQNSLLPIGSILIWNSKLPPPAGWVICDGTNDTPDLRGRFPFGSANYNDNGTPGGSLTHAHQATVSSPSPSWKSDNADQRSVAHPNHTHKVTISEANHLPPYVNVSFIMKIR